MKEKRMSYGEGLYNISEVDIWKDKLRIKVIDRVNEKEQWIFMGPKEAQSLVIDSYKDPINTFSTNIMGTVNILETIRMSESIKTGVLIKQLG